MTVLLVLAALGLLSLLHECGHLLAARALSLTVTDVSLGLGPPILRRRWGGARLHVGVLPFGGFVRVAELLPSDEPPPGHFAWRRTAARLAVIAGGPLANYAIAALCGVVVAVGYGVDTGRIRGLKVTAVGAHAAQVGLRPGDLLQRVEGHRVARVADLSRQLSAAGGEPVELEVIRVGTVVRLSASPIQRGGRWGFDARYAAVPERRDVSLPAAVGHGASLPMALSRQVLVNATDMLLPDSEVRPLSPVGLADRVARTRGWCLPRALRFAALLSVVVGLFNLLPLPGLDGGRLVVEATQGVLRRPLPRRWVVGLHVLGAVVLLALWLGLAADELLALF